MSINYNDRTGVLGINLTPQFNNLFQTAGLFGFGKSDEEKALEQIQDLRKQENQIKGLGEGAIELKQNELQNIQNQIENLKKQYPNDSSIQSASLPSNRYTADLRNLNDRMTDIPDRLSRGLDYDLINKVREYNPNYDRYTDQEITELGIPIFNKTMPSSMNSGVTNANNFRSMLLDDLRNLPSDFRTSLGQTKDALVEDVSGLGSFLKDKSMNLFNSGTKKSNGIMDMFMSFLVPGYNFIKNGQPYERYTPGGTTRDGIYSIDGVNVPVSSFGGDFYNPRTGLNRFDRARQRYEQTGKVTDLFASSRTGKEFFEKMRERKAQKQKALEDAAAAKRKFTTYTSGGGDRDPGPKFDNTGGDIGSKGAADRFSNTTGKGRTGY